MNIGKYIFLFFLMTFVMSVSAQEGSKVEQEIMSGNVTLKDFFREPHKTWYEKEYNTYKIDLKALRKSGKINKKINIIVYFGSWCGDSRREVPRFNKITKKLKIKNKKVKYIGLDRSKTAPEYKENIHDIEFVPTFIFFRNNKEIGRIIESPEESLEKDIMKILADIQLK